MTKLILIAAGIILAGCTPEKAADAPTSATPSSVEGWMGKWTGPEGTSLTLSKSGDSYAVHFQTLDGPTNFVGRAVGDTIEFERNGQTESIRATDGKGTGMKWLADKTNCLTIRMSEGFCRDPLPSPSLMERG